MNDFSNVLWSYGGDYFDNGKDVGRMGSRDPGDPCRLDSDAAIAGAEFYNRLLVASPTRPPRRGTGTAWAPRSAPAGWRCARTGTSSRPATRQVPPGKVGYAALPKGPGGTANMYGGTGVGINANTMPERAQARLAVPRLGDLARDAARQPQEQGRRRHPHAYSVYELPEVRAAEKRAVVDAQHAHGRRGAARPGSPSNIGLRPKIPMWNECNTAIFTQLSRMLTGAAAAGGGDAFDQGAGGPIVEREGGWPDGASPQILSRCPRRTRPQSAAPKEPRVGFEGRMMAPGLILLAALSIVPFLALIAMSFSRVRLLGGVRLELVGITNWARFFTDADMWMSWLRTIIYFVLTVGLEMVLGIGHRAVPVPGAARPQHPAQPAAAADVRRARRSSACWAAT